MIALFSWVSPAQAAGLQMVCVDLDVEYADAYVGDRWHNNDVHKAARGFRYKVVNAATNTVAAQGFLDAEGSDAGCTVVSLPAGNYRVKLFPEVEVDQVSIAFCTQSALLLGTSAFTVIDDSPGHHNPTQSFSVARLPTKEYEQLVAMAYALTWFADGLQGEALTLCDIQDNTANRWVGATETIWLEPDLDRKQTIVHELGHAVAYYLSGGVPGAGGADQNNCQGSDDDTRGILSKEYTSFVIKEGIATFFSLVTWNSVANGCEWGPNSNQDWDLDGTFEWQESALIPIGCDEEDDPDTEAPDYTDGIDWLSDLVLASDPAGCVGPTLNRSTAWDWGTYWWALYADEGMPLGTVFAVLGEAVHEPTDWDTNGSTTQWTDDPLFRWVAAMDAAGWSAAHEAHDDHVDH